MDILIPKIWLDLALSFWSFFLKITDGYGTFCCLILLFTVLEMIWPLRPTRNLFQSFKTEYGFLIGNPTLLFLLIDTLNPYLPKILHKPLLSALASVPFIPQFLIAVIISEFIYYWYHRAYHTIPFLWQFHRLHHSLEDLNTLNGSIKFHVVESLTTYLLTLGLFLLGFSHKVVYVYLTTQLFFTSWAHCNLTGTYGSLNNWFVTPQIHQFHHNGDPPYQVNYGNWLTIFDQLFGTYYLPFKTAFPERTGLEHSAKTGKYPYPITGWWKPHLYPLRGLLPKTFFKQGKEILPYDQPGIIPKRLIAKAALGQVLAPTLSGDCRLSLSRQKLKEKKNIVTE